MMRMIALHPRPLARQHAGRDAVAGHRIALRKAMAGGEGDDGAVIAGRSPFRIADARHCPRRILDRQRRLAQRLWRHIATVVEVEQRRRAVQQPLGGGEARPAILGRGARHRHHPLGQRIQPAVGQVGRRHARRSLSHEHPQAQLAALRPADILQLSQPHRHRQGGIGDEDRIGGIRAVPLGKVHGSMGTIDGLGRA